MNDPNVPRLYYPRAEVALTCLFDTDPPTPPMDIIAIPRSVSVQRNSARKADTCTVEIDYRDFPLDPRAIKDIVLTVFMGNVANAQQPLNRDDPASRVFIGLVDEPSTTLDGTDQVVRLEARDYTGIYLDRKWSSGIAGPGGSGVSPSIPTPPGLTLRTVVDLIRMQVTPLLEPAIFDDPAAEALDVNRRTGRELFTSEDDDSAWDVLSALLDLFGLVPVFVLDRLHIRSPTWPGTQLAFMVYGRNVEQLKFSRSLKQKRSKQVKVVAWNPLLGAVLEAVYPPTGAAEVTRLDEQGVPSTTIQQVQYNVEGPYDPATLLQLAQSVYAEMSSEQLMGEIETSEMSDLLDGGLLTLANGDQLVCQIGTEDIASVASMSEAEAVAFLSDPTRPNAIAPEVAAVLMKAWSSAQSGSVTFYVLEVEHSWDREDGYRCSIKFRDYILGV
jgi:hypothetical protein